MSTKTSAHPLAMLAYPPWSVEVIGCKACEYPAGNVVDIVGMVGKSMLERESSYDLLSHRKD